MHPAHHVRPQALGHDRREMFPARGGDFDLDHRKVQRQHKALAVELIVAADQRIPQLRPVVGRVAVELDAAESPARIDETRPATVHDDIAERRVAVDEDEAGRHQPVEQIGQEIRARQRIRARPAVDLDRLASGEVGRQLRDVRETGERLVDVHLADGEAVDGGDVKGVEAGQGVHDRVEVVGGRADLVRVPATQSVECYGAIQVLPKSQSHPKTAPIGFGIPLCLIVEQLSGCRRLRPLDDSLLAHLHAVEPPRRRLGVPVVAQRLRGAVFADADHRHVLQPQMAIKKPRHELAALWRADQIGCLGHVEQPEHSALLAIKRQTGFLPTRYLVRDADYRIQMMLNLWRLVEQQIAPHHRDRHILLQPRRRLRDPPACPVAVRFHDAHRHARRERIEIALHDFAAVIDDDRERRAGEGVEGVVEQRLAVDRHETFRAVAGQGF